MGKPSVVELCAGAGGQSLGLELAGFEHALAVELDAQAACTLRTNRPWDVRVGDAADPKVWRPKDYRGVDLLAGGVPCPPFSIAGKQLGAEDERDLFAWAVELVRTVEPKALLLENVRGLSTPRFSAYRQYVRDRLAEYGYWSSWRLMHASDFGVPQLRPRFVLVALQHSYAHAFSWPSAGDSPATVGETLYDLMAVRGWKGAKNWVGRASAIAPTIVGGSKKHGGADLGPTRAKKAWASLGVDALGVADEAPSLADPIDLKPKLTCEMVSRLQGWQASGDYKWVFTGRKTSRYRQIGNAFPPPVARAVGESIFASLAADACATPTLPFSEFLEDEIVHDEIYRLLRDVGRPVTAAELQSRMSSPLKANVLVDHLRNLGRDFLIEEHFEDGELKFMLGDFKAFVGQERHVRHKALRDRRSRIS